MIEISLKGGDVMEVDSPKSVFEIAKSISEGLARVATAAQVNGTTVDLRTIIDEDVTLNILTFDDEDGKSAYRHTASHIMAQAVKRLFPSA